MEKYILPDGIKNIVFDLGGVIINIDHYQTANAFRKLGVYDFIDRFSHSKQHEIFDQHEKGLISDSEFRVMVMNELNISVSEDVFDQAWNAILLDIPKERIELLIELKRRHRIFMLSNTNSIHMKRMNEYIKKQYGIPSYKSIFEKAYYSFELGMRKPDKEIFEFVINDTGILPEETLFVDDSEPNIKTAVSLGIAGLHYPKNADLLHHYLL